MWTCSRGRAVVLRTIAPEKGWRGIGMSEPCRAVPYSSPCVPLCSAGTEQRCGQRMGGAECTQPFMQDMRPSGTQSRAGCSSSTSGLLLAWGIFCAAHWGAGHGDSEGEDCSASTRGFDYLFCLFPKWVLTRKLFQQLQKSTVFSSQPSL